MALQALYSFDHIVTADLIALPEVISVGSLSTVSTSGGRDGGGCLVSTGEYTSGVVIALRRPHNNVTFGAWVVVEDPENGWEAIVLGNPANGVTNNPRCAHTSLVFQLDGSIAIWRQIPALGTKLATTAPGVFTVNIPFYLEWNSVISSSGSTIIKINEVEVLNRTGIDNDVSTDDNVTLVAITNSFGRTRWDDMYILTGENTGDGWNSFRGILKIDGKLVNGAGAHTDWTPSIPSGVNFSNVDDTTPNATDYNDAATVGLIDTYELQDVTFDPVAVQVDLYARKLDAGPSSIAHVVRQAGIDYVSAELSALSAEYKYYRKAYTLAPDSSAWTAAIYNALQAGIKKAL